MTTMTGKEGRSAFLSVSKEINSVNDTKNGLVVAGFLFGTKEDAELAKKEEEKVKYLESHMDYSNVENVEAIFRKALEQRTFKTPIGFLYLKHLQNFLYKHKVLNVPDIPMYHIFATGVLEKAEKTRTRVNPPAKKDKEKQKLKEKLRWSYIINVASVIIIAALFAIALTSDNPNILNYENTLQNRYAEWEEKLKEREAAVREKELLYDIKYEY